MLFAAVSTAGGGLLVGRDRGIAVSGDYAPPFPFDGILSRVTVRSVGAADPPVEEATRRD